MSCVPHIAGTSVIHRLDPRLRILSALSFSIIVALLHNLLILATALAVSLALTALSRIPPTWLWKRFSLLLLLFALLFILIPPATPGVMLLSIGPLDWSVEGVQLASRIFLRAFAILLTWTALVTTISPVTFGHALGRLGVPQALVQMLFFTIRYVGVLTDEYRRILRSMRIRGFRPSATLHTVRAYGYAIGSLLIRSFHRSERILASMKCRGYHGSFPAIDHFSWRRIDSAAGLLMFGLTIGLGVWQWL